MASICNDERGRFGVLSGHDRKTLSLSAPGRIELPAHGLRHIGGAGLAAQVTGVQRGGGGDRLDGLHQALGGGRLADVIQQHHAGPEGADGVGQALAHDVEGRAVDGLEHRRVAPLGVDVAGGRDAQATRQRGGQVAQDVGMQIGGHQGVQ